MRCMREARRYTLRAAAERRTRRPQATTPVHQRAANDARAAQAPRDPDQGRGGNLLQPVFVVLVLELLGSLVASGGPIGPIARSGSQRSEGCVRRIPTGGAADSGAAADDLARRRIELA